ncbi:MAG: hypothetical protein HYV68_03765 [Candidatus Taylorbacteria bacterium]|nr:hypothetical protein [Candidatus Taylorbacteria bacterium]
MDVGETDFLSPWLLHGFRVFKKVELYRAVMVLVSPSGLIPTTVIIAAGLKYQGLAVGRAAKLTN